MSPVLLSELAMNVEGPKAEADTAKQIIALSTGAVAFTVTFLEKFKTANTAAPLPLPISLYVAWILFGVTVGFALWYLMAVNGTISAIGRKENGWPLTAADQLSADGDDGNLWLPGILMVVSFFLAIVALIWLGFSLART